MLAPFAQVHENYKGRLLKSPTIDTGEWHSKKVDHPLLVTMELLDCYFSVWVGDNLRTWELAIEPNLPWAEDHFQERVGGQPLNPAPSHRWWPWAHDQHHDENEIFDHTYPERFWPKQAGLRNAQGELMGDSTCWGPIQGIRFEYGDLDDVVNLLVKSPLTRQAYLPVFFPEDTGGHERMGGRIPCSMGYHFLIRNNEMNIFYPMRSCDFVRHFRDDVYLAGRLLQWMVQSTKKQGLRVKTGKLTMHVSSLHAMEGDRAKMEGRV